MVRADYQHNALAGMAGAGNGREVFQGEKWPERLAEWVCPGNAPPLIKMGVAATWTRRLERNL